jgi:hypothetical protein
VGGLIQKVVDTLSKENIKQNWAEYELWWPEQRKWLLKHHWMLDKYSIQADTELVFTNRNKLLFVELPNRQCIKATVNFSSDVLSVVRDICYLCEIRHHTELSLIRSQGQPKTDCHSYQTLDGTQTPVIQLNNSVQPVYSTLRSPGRHGSKNEVLNSGTRLIDVSNKEYKKLSAPGNTLDPDKLEPPKNLREKVENTCRFLDSLKSLMEQNVKENDLVQLRFKYFTFHTLNEKSDVFRIHQLYEQLKFSVLSDEFPVSEDQALTLASLQYFIDDCHQKQIFDADPSGREDDADQMSTTADITAMLDSLEMDLEGSPLNQPDLRDIPELSEFVKIHYPNKLLSRSFKSKVWLTYRDTALLAFKTREEAASGSHQRELFHIEIKRAELTPEVSIKEEKFIVKIKPHERCVCSYINT